MLAAAVEAVAGIALERLVADLVPERLAHGTAHDVLRSDELDPDALAARLVVERGAHLRIGVGERPRDVDRKIGAGVHRACHRIAGSRGGRGGSGHRGRGDSPGFGGRPERGYRPRHSGPRDHSPGGDRFAAVRVREAGIAGCCRVLAPDRAAAGARTPAVPGTGWGSRFAPAGRIAVSTAATDPRRAAFSRFRASGRFTGRSSPTIAGLLGRPPARTPGAEIYAGAEPPPRNRTPRRPGTAPHGASTGKDA